MILDLPTTTLWPQYVVKDSYHLFKEKNQYCSCNMWLVTEFNNID